MEHLLPPLPAAYAAPITVAESLQAIRHFLHDAAPAQVQQELWDILRKAMASPEADSWDHIARSNVLHLYEQIAKVVLALPPLMTMLPDV